MPISRMKKFHSHYAPYFDIHLPMNLLFSLCSMFTVIAKLEKYIILESQTTIF